MTNKSESPQAFPSGPETTERNGEYGMTLHEYYVGQALIGIMANPERWKQIAKDYESGKKTYEQCSEANAIKAHSIADAVMKERSK